MPKAYVFYHFLYPDNVVSAVLMGELGSGLVQLGWDVTAFPSMREHGNERDKYPRRDIWQGVKIERIWRPAWQQTSGAGRILNAAWMIGRWMTMSMQKQHRPDVIIIGTDPFLSILIAPVWRYFKPNTKIAHWCFDLYPEAAYAEGILDRQGILAKILHRQLKKAYRACDIVVDIGRCMRELLLRYDPNLKITTLVPWAQVEPDSALPIAMSERENVIGNVRLALMYSGSFGRAHSFDGMLEIARLLRSDDIHLALSVRGNREQALREAVCSDDTNIRFVPFADASHLGDRLASADIHVVSLREEWTGMVVPSKFFGALAIGRPVLYCGSERSAIAQWIQEHKVGWVLTCENVLGVADELRSYSLNKSEMDSMNERCHRVYTQHFSRNVVLRGWHRQLCNLMGIHITPMPR